jgi:hypothetical protein
MHGHVVLSGYEDDFRVLKEDVRSWIKKSCQPTCGVRRVLFVVNRNILPGTFTRTDLGQQSQSVDRMFLHYLF